MPRSTNKLFIIAVFATSCFSTSVFGGSGNTGDTAYLPLQIGNHWVWTKDGRQFTETIVDTVRLKGDLFFRFDTLFYENDVFLRQSGSQVFRWLDTAAVLWYDFSADSGATWVLPGRGDMTVLATMDTVVGSAGTFRNCRSLFWFPGPDAGSTDWFARGTGFVKRVTISLHGTTLWRLSSAVISSAQGGMDHAADPASFTLEQNFPNPFNPETTIRFAIGKTSRVGLRIFDILGRNVATLVDGNMEGGNHSITWNAANLPTGIYFYRMWVAPQAKSATKRLMLIK